MPGLPGRVGLQESGVAAASTAARARPDHLHRLGRPSHAAQPRHARKPADVHAVAGSLGAGAERSVLPGHLEVAFDGSADRSRRLPEERGTGRQLLERRRLRRADHLFHRHVRGHRRPDTRGIRLPEGGDGHPDRDLDGPLLRPRAVPADVVGGRAPVRAHELSCLGERPRLVRAAVDGSPRRAEPFVEQDFVALLP